MGLRCHIHPFTPAAAGHGGQGADGIASSKIESPDPASRGRRLPARPAFPPTIWGAPPAYRSPPCARRTDHPAEAVTGGGGQQTPSQHGDLLSGAGSKLPSTFAPSVSSTDASRATIPTVRALAGGADRSQQHRASPGPGPETAKKKKSTKKASGNWQKKKTIKHPARRMTPGDWGARKKWKLSGSSRCGVDVSDPVQEKRSGAVTAAALRSGQLHVTLTVTRVTTAGPRSHLRHATTGVHNRVSTTLIVMRADRPHMHTAADQFRAGARHTDRRVFHTSWSTLIALRVPGWRRSSRAP